MTRDVSGTSAAWPLCGIGAVPRRRCRRLSAGSEQNHRSTCPRRTTGVGASAEHRQPSSRLACGEGKLDPALQLFDLGRSVVQQRSDGFADRLQVEVRADLVVAGQIGAHLVYAEQCAGQPRMHDASDEIVGRFGGCLRPQLQPLTQEAGETLVCCREDRIVETGRALGKRSASEMARRYMRMAAVHSRSSMNRPQNCTSASLVSSA